MQRTTSAFTAAVLGAVLTASTALAQQAPAPEGAPPDRGPSTKAKAGPTTATEAANSQLYGMSVTRGARYLLRNGLDYLSYQEYDRALKFLREAEARVTDQKTRKVQMELNDAEVTALKQGIETAQRGLRRASNAESPYALSDQSRPSNGFTPASASTRLAARGSQANAMNRQAKATPPASLGLLGNDGDDDQGQPVRLASAEMPASDQPAELSPMVRSASNKNAPTSGSADSNASTSAPEPPQIPLVSRLPDLTKVNGSEQEAAADDQNRVKAQPAVIPDRTIPGQTRSSTAVIPDQTTPGQTRSSPADTQIHELAPALIPPPMTMPEIAPADLQSAQDRPPEPAEPSSLIPQTLEASPSVVPAFKASTNAKAQDQAPGLPISDGNTAAPTTVATTPALSSPIVVGATTDGPAAPLATSRTTESSPKRPVIDLETIPSAAVVGDAPQKVDSGAPHQEASDAVPASDPGPAPATPLATPDRSSKPVAASTAVAPPAVDSGAPHQEASDAVPASDPGPAPATPLATPDRTSKPMAASTAVDGELPPLPANPRQSVSNTTVTDSPKAQPTPADVSVPASPVDDDLPPLPTLGARPTPLPAEGTQAPAQTLAAPIAGAVPAGTTIAGEPAQPSGAGSVQPVDEPLPVLPTAIERQPAVTAAGGEGSTVIPSQMPSVPDSSTAPINPPTLPESPKTERPQLPDSNASAPPTAPVSASYPTTNPNLESQPIPTPATRVETQPDVSSLPPALAGRTLASSTDDFLPDRANPPSTLKPELQREVERIARRQEDEMHRQAQNPTQPANPPRDTMASDLRTQTQMDISRAPSPAEARPIKAIPVPEDWVPLAPRNWAPQRKYWAAAATCHLPLYFQDPVLERYGHSVEQFVGPLGRFLTYPLDDPTQSTQRNQMLQPFFSAGLMGLQIIAWPYNLIMDPPWEAQYDLGYYRPGDSIPTDTYWLPLHGYGPPLRGSNY